MFYLVKTMSQAIAVAKDAAKGVAELQDNVTNSLKLQEEEEGTQEPSTENKEPESPEDKLRNAALQKLEQAGQDTALSHVSIAFILVYM